MTKFIHTIIFLAIYISSYSQRPQIALVHSNQNMEVYSNLDSAYTHAVDGDNIYLPGGTFKFTNPINKRLFIYGAGANIDSSQVTGITRLEATNIGSGAAGGLIEGVKFHTGIYSHSLIFGGIPDTTTMISFTLSKCMIDFGIKFVNNCSNVIIKNCLIGSTPTCSYCSNSISITGFLNNSLLSNNIIQGNITITNEAYLTVKNNIFTFYVDYMTLNLPNYSIFQDNIFQSGVSCQNSTFYNNANLNVNSSQGNQVFSSLFETWNLSFTNPGIEEPVSKYRSPVDFHLLNTSQFKNGGRNGGDLGIYDGDFLWIDGMIPSNPHIYYKQIPTQTNSSGQLPITIKVRTNN